VVATGIDTVAVAAQPPQARVTEITQRQRVEAPRAAEPRPEQQARPAQQPQPASRASVEHAATAAVAAALSSHDEVTVRPITPKPSLFVEPVMADPEVPKTFIPPQPERSSRPRMPRIDELPMPAQNEIRAHQGETEDSGPEKQRMTLLQRLAAVGLGRREEAPAQPAQPEERAQERAPQRSQLPPLPQRQPVRMPEPAVRQATQGPQGLDMHGRPALPVHKPVDDDQLEIPAFLRRQAN
jgi:cell division protein FtsZ